MIGYEVNFDCLVGPTHHFGGLSLGNLASHKSKAQKSYPKAAALQGLEKMRFLHERGFKQAVLPPHPRPHFATLKRLGFSGTDQQIVRKAFDTVPDIFSKLSSSSAMWAANAATVCPSRDAKDKKVHITPANLNTMFHRSIEGDFTYQVFKQIFFDDNFFTVHPPLPQHDIFSDEGAANHNRLCPSYTKQGLQIFVFGKEAGLATQKTTRFPARQSKQANLALARLHQLRDDYFLNLEQNPIAIDEGAFHNDVVAVANESVFLVHELAFAQQKAILSQLEEYYQELYQTPLHLIRISNKLLPIKDAVQSYLFNSQLLSKPDGTMMLFSPLECKNNARAEQAIKFIVAGDNPINEVHYFNVSESMANGGGPACLRLRVVLLKKEFDALLKSVILTDTLYKKLHSIIENYYPEQFDITMLLDKNFLHTLEQAYQEIAEALGLKNLYQF